MTIDEMKNMSIEEVDAEIKKIKDVDELVSQANAFRRYFSVYPDKDAFPFYKVGDVIDEDKSVKWNREEVERLIIARKNEADRLREFRTQVLCSYSIQLRDLLAKENRIDTQLAIVIYRKAYENAYQDDFDDVVAEFNDLVGFAFDCIHAHKVAEKAHNS